MQLGRPARAAGAPFSATRYVSFAIVLIAACAQSISSAWPFDSILPLGQTLWWLQLLALASVVWLLSTAQTVAQAVLTAWLFATLWLATAFSWLFVAMHTYGDMHALIAAGAVVLLAAALGLYYALACGIWRYFQSRTYTAPILFAAAWTFAEMARGMWFTGFGWGAVGYSHNEGPLRQFVPWVGAYGVTFLAAWVAAALGTLQAQTTRKLLTITTLLVLPAAIPESWSVWSTPHKTTGVALLQGNIPQDEKFETGSGIPLALKWYGEQLLTAKAALVVAPETAIPLLPRQLPDGYWKAIEERYANGPQAAMVGIPLGNYEEGYSNSVVGIATGQSAVWRYDKHHLVPFGEFIPPFFRWFTNLMNIPLGDFNRGAIGQPSFEFDGQRFAANVCYEDLFGEELGARFADPL
ncbi:MAG: apolipoprotein N-acyltransferase, partial [Rhodoferax sp.]